MIIACCASLRGQQRVHPGPPICLVCGSSRTSKGWGRDGAGARRFHSVQALAQPQKVTDRIFEQKRPFPWTARERHAYSSPQHSTPRKHRVRPFLHAGTREPKVRALPIQGKYIIKSSREDNQADLNLNGVNHFFGGAKGVVSRWGEFMVVT